MIRIEALLPGKRLKEFIDFPHELHKDDPNYVPELFVAQQDMLTPGKHPFYEHSTVQLFLAYKDERLVGRIAAIWNKNHIEFTGNSEGFFGFFDVINDQEVAEALLQSASSWVKEKGGEKIIGPVTLSTNESCGLLIEGYDSPPVAMMLYNPPYYKTILENAGYTKQVDLYAYQIVREEANERSVKLLSALEARLAVRGIKIRQVNLKDFKNEVRKIREVYNKAWDKNLGFVPTTESEFDYLAKDLKMILDPKYCLVAEKGDEFVGFILGIPDINQILIKIKKGRLLPTGIFKLLFQKKDITCLRVITLGVLEDYRKLGIEACLYGSVIRNAEGSKIKTSECSWMLEHNYLMNRAIEQINGKLYKRYRIFEKQV